MPVDAGKIHAVRQYDITDYNKYIVLGAFGGGSDQFNGEEKFFLSGLYATLLIM